MCVSSSARVDIHRAAVVYHGVYNVSLDGVFAFVVQTSELSLVKPAVSVRVYHKTVVLRVVLGEGKGQNWWCVAFPPLCLGAASESIDEATAAGYFSPDQAALVTEQDQGYVIKFKSMELLGQLQGLLFS